MADTKPKLHSDEEPFAHLLKEGLTKEEARELEKYQGEYRTKKSEKFFEQLIRPILPNAKVSGTGNIGNPIWFHRSGWIRGLDSNESFKGSQYDMPLNPTTRFVHFTSVPVLLSILREASIRMYDLNHMDDPHEFSFSAKEIGYETDWDLNNARSQLFSFSMVAIDEDFEKEDFNLWRFGMDGRGVAIVLSIDESTQYDWYDYHLSKVSYSETPPSPLKGFTERVEEFNSNEGFHVKRPRELLLKLAAFHKRSFFSFEKEVRLLRFDEHELWSDVSFKEPLPRTLSIDVGSNRKKSFFHRLYLGKEWEERYNLPASVEEKYGNAYSLYPRLKIDKVIMGYRLTPGSTSDTQEVIHQLAKHHLGYNFELVKSKFFDHFNS